jgi:hypothetical protein
MEGELPRPRSPANGTKPCLAHPCKRFHGCVSGPRADPYRTGHDLHLNCLITAQRGTHDSRPARWELWAPHPSVPWRDGEGAYEQDGENAPITSNGPRLGGSTHGYTSWICTERRRVSIRAHGTAEAG